LNIARTTWLSLAAFRHGPSGVEAWHDSAGVAVLLVNFAAVFAAARWMAGKQVTEERADRGGTGRFPAALAWSGTAWLVAAELFTGIWFSSGTTPAAPLVLAWNDLRFQPMAVPDRTKSILRCDRAEARAAMDGNGGGWRVYHVFWGENSPGAPLARYHSPEVCLPMAGLRLAGRGTPVRAGISGGELVFQSYQFEWLRQPMFVFFAFREGAEPAHTALASEFDLTWEKRWQRTLSRRRPGAQETLEFAVTGVATWDEARDRFAEILGRAVEIRETGGTR
jgi:hypothetical protein